MEHEIINKETPEMKETISGIHEVANVFGRLPNARPLFGGEIYLTGREVCERLFVSPRTLQDYRLFPTPKSQGKYSIASHTSTGYSKRTIGDRASS